MKQKLLLFGGTTEAREIAESGLPMICCVATEYGAEVLHEAPGLDVRTGRLDAAGMAALIREEEITAVADATHPYARAVTAEIKKACAETGADYMRIVRARTPLPGNAALDLEGHLKRRRADAELFHDFFQRGGIGKIKFTGIGCECSLFHAVGKIRHRTFSFLNSDD